MQKYATVEIIEESDGIVAPSAILWSGGRHSRLEKFCTPVLRTYSEFEGIRYTGMIGCAVKYLYRDGQQWYVGCSP